MGRGIGREGERMALGRLAQRVAYHPRLHARKARGGVERDHAVKVFRAIDDERHVDALAALRRAAAPRQDRHAVLAGERDRGHDVLDAARQHHADRDLPVVGSVGGIGRARPRIEAHFAGDRLSQARFESLKIDHV